MKVYVPLDFASLCREFRQTYEALAYNAEVLVSAYEGEIRRLTHERENDLRQLEADRPPACPKCHERRTVFTRFGAGKHLVYSCIPCKFEWEFDGE